jgi:hypothetical protein
MRQLRHVDPFHRIANTAGCSPAFGQDQTIARFAVIALLVLAAAPVAQASPQRVLFVGNSLTAANDLPAMVAALARGAGRPIDADVRAPGGFALEDHWRTTDVAQAIADGHYDVVVLQQGPTSLPESRVDLLEWGRTFAVAIRAAGGRPAFFTVWPESWRSYAFDAVIYSYRAAARENNALLLPAGLAWKSVLRTNPGIKLYGPDGFHPSRLGTYLAAVTIAAGITGKPAVGMARLGVSVRAAAILQRAAAAALRSP